MASITRREVLRHAGMQGGIQLVGLVAGILVVRNLTKEQYALYALCFAMMGAVTMLSDSGMTSTFLSRGALAVESRPLLSALAAAAINFRKRWGSAVLIPALVLLAWQLWANGASGASTAGLVGITAATALLQMRQHVFENVHRLLHHTRLLADTQLAGNLVRLGLLVAVMVAGRGSAASLALASTLAFAMTLWWLARQARRHVDRVAPSGDDMRPYWRNLRSVLPTTLALILGEQLFYVLMSIRGTTEVLAEVSALSRFGMVFIVANALIADIGAPTIARLVGSPAVVTRRIGTYALIYLGFCVAVIGAIAWLATPLLTILGSQYAGLESAFVLIAVAYSVINLGHTLNGLVQARGWVWGWPVHAGLLVIWVAWGFSLDLTDVHVASIFFGAQAIPYITLQLVRIVSALRGREPVRDTSAPGAP